MAAGDVPQQVPTTPVAVTDVATTDDGVEFDVSDVGQPVLVKVSYFPNWKADGADGPWRVGPNLMVVVPTSTHVSLSYGYTSVDYLGWLITALGIVGLVLLVRRGPLHMPPPQPWFRHDEPGGSADPGGPGGPDDPDDPDDTGDGDPHPPDEHARPSAATFDPTEAILGAPEPAAVPAAPRPAPAEVIAPDGA
jgi:hypothetical protein